MPRPRKIIPPNPETAAQNHRAALALIAPMSRGTSEVPTSPISVVTFHVVADDLITALHDAEERANAIARMLEKDNSITVVDIRTQTLYLERHTHWQVVVTIVYRGGGETCLTYP